MKTKRIDLLILIGVLVSLTGCSTYSTFEGDLPREEYAVLKTRTGRLVTGPAGVVEVDGKVLDEGYSRVKTESGDHHIVFQQNWSNKYKERIEAKLRLDGGRSYLFDVHEPPDNAVKGFADLGIVHVSYPTYFNLVGSKTRTFRPFNSSVWIYDEDSRDVIWGTPPSDWR